MNIQHALILNIVNNMDRASPVIEDSPDNEALMPASPTIGVISNDFDGPFHSPLIEKIHQELQQIDGRLIFIWGGLPAIAETQLATARVNGWIVVNASEGASRLATLGKPVILISGRDANLPSVLPDNRSGTLEAINHLIEAGHTRIAFVGNLANLDFRERYDVYREVLENNGIAFDPELVVDPHGYDLVKCLDAVVQLLARGVQFEAVFGANDWAAMGAIQALHEAGRHVPNDVAVVGFDDMTAAQYHQPPLSSVRQRPDELGRVALHLLLDQIAGRGTPPLLTRVPTKLIIRDSSRPARSAGDAADRDNRYRTADWQARLKHDLVQVALDPVPLDPVTAPEELWPSIGELIAAIDTLEHGGMPAPISQRVWQQGGELAGGVSALLPVLNLLRLSGYQRIDQLDRRSNERFIDWLIEGQRMIATDTTAQLADQFERQRMAVWHENALLLHFNQAGANPRMLDWMETTPTEWAALGLWNRGDRIAAGELNVTSIYERGHGARPANLSVAAKQFPPFECIPEALKESPEYILKLSPLATATRQWGYIATMERYFAAGYDTIHNRNMYIANVIERTELLDSLSQRQQTLQEAYERERGLAGTIRELGCPLIPLLPGVLLVPLIGALDEHRAEQIIDRVLNGVSQERASHVLLDITGVPIVDTYVAAALIRTAQAASLLGARVIIVGVRPEIAQSIVSLNVDLGKIETRPNLAAAIQPLIRSAAARGLR
jgi:DNA-binding LacI/PurR family transcriptional regulator/anti-anti-sigma regulatory factor